MRRLVFVLLLVVFLAGCASQAPRGEGVSVSVMNYDSLQNIYVPIDGSVRDLDEAFDNLNRPDGEFIKVGELDLMVHNRGYADSLVALYVTGYDPNLFAVLPTGPYVLQGDAQRCYKDIQIGSDGEYSFNALCAASEEITLGGGVSRSDSGTVIDLAGYNLNVGRWLERLEERITGSEDGLFARFGDLFDGLNINCRIENPDEGRVSGSCRLGSQLLDFFSQRSTRGSLLLALYGGDVRECGNDCVVVPSRRFESQPYLRGDTEFTPGGEAEQVRYNMYMNRERWPASLDSHEQLFQVSACYLYTTYATPVVCISPTGRSSDSDVCRPGVQEIGHGQPAPLRISRIDQTNQGSRIMYTVHVQNQMNGRVFHPGAVDFCAPGAPDQYNRELRDVAKVIDARILGELDSLDCRDGTIRLDQRGQGQINCFMEIPPEAYNRGAYQTTLNIEIGYLYREQQTVFSSIHRI